LKALIRLISSIYPTLQDSWFHTLTTHFSSSHYRPARATLA
jgi:hypothetical protein